VGGIYAHQQPRPVSVCSTGLNEVSVCDGNDLGGILEVGGHGTDGGPLGGDCLLELRFDDRLLAIEMLVELAEADVGGLGDVVDARAVDALAREQGLGNLDQMSPGSLAPARASVRRGWTRSSRGVIRLGVRDHSRRRIAAARTPEPWPLSSDRL